MKARRLGGSAARRLGDSAAGRLGGSAARRLSALTALTALSALITACSPGAQDETIHLRFWTMGREGEVVAPLVREFERLNPGVRVDIQQMPWTAAHEKLLTAHVGGTSPDISQLGNTWIYELAMLGAIQPLDSLLGPESPIRADAYFPGIWNTNFVGDTLFGVPWYVDTRVLFYRTDLLEQAGIDSMPVTWAAWRAAMVKLKQAAGPRQWPIFLPTNEWMQPVILALQNGSTITDSAGRRGAFTEPAFREAFEFYVGLFKDDLAPPMGNADVANVWQEFARGTFAMYPTGPWNLGEFRRRLPDSLQDKWSTAPLPGPDGPGASFAGGSSLVVFRSSEHPREALALIEFLSRPESQSEFFRLSGNLPPRRDAWQDSLLANDPKVHAFREQLERLVSPPHVPEVELIVTRVYEQAERAIRGHAPVPVVLNALDAQVDRILEKRRWVLDQQAAAAADEAENP